MFDPTDLGRDISRSVRDAIETLDFTELKEVIRSSVRDGISPTDPGSTNSSKVPNESPADRNDPPKTSAPAKPKAEPERLPNRLPGKAPGITMMVLGSVGVSAFTILYAILILPLLIMGSRGGSIALISFFLVPLIGACVWLIFHGSDRVRLAEHFRHLARLLKGARYAQVQKLALSLGLRPRVMARELRKMISKGMFPDAYLDPAGTTLMLDRETYDQYLALMEHVSETAKVPEAAQAQTSAAEDPTGPFADGRRYLAQIRSLNDEIPDPVLTTRLNRLDLVAGRVLDLAEKKSSKKTEVRRFVTYYLPTTLKLVRAYRDFDREPVSDDGHVAKAQQEIRDVIDTINAAFENLLDEMYADDALDISSDIAAMEALLARDGLTDSDFPNGRRS